MLGYSRATLTKSLSCHLMSTQPLVISSNHRSSCALALSSSLAMCFSRKGPSLVQYSASRDVCFNLRLEDLAVLVEGRSGSPVSSGVDAEKEIRAPVKKVVMSFTLGVLESGRIIVARKGDGAEGTPTACMSPVTQREGVEGE